MHRRTVLFAVSADSAPAFFIQSTQKIPAHPWCFSYWIFIRSYSWTDIVAPSQVGSSFAITWYKWIYYPTYNRLDGLLSGVSIAALFHYKPAVKSKIQAYGNWLLLAGLILLLAAYFLCEEELSYPASVFGFPLVSLGYGFLVAGAVLPSSFLYKMKPALTSRIANLSYGIYLVHKLVIHLTQTAFMTQGIEQDSTLLFFICLLSTVLAAFLVNVIIEKPFLKLRDNILRKDRRLPVPGKL